MRILICLFVLFFSFAKAEDKDLFIKDYNKERFSVFLKKDPLFLKHKIKTKDGIFFSLSDNGCFYSLSVCEKYDNNKKILEDVLKKIDSFYGMKLICKKEHLDGKNFIFDLEAKGDGFYFIKGIISDRNVYTMITKSSEKKREKHKQFIESFNIILK